jgi:hypothetical protein
MGDIRQLDRLDSLGERLWQLWRLVWASPGSLVGLTLGLVGLCTGGGVRRVAHTLEFHGGFVHWLLKHTPVDAGAMTLGHVVIGRTAEILDSAREHEWVHIRQYERWGPLFIPAYLGCSACLWLMRREAYRGNPFEREAFEHDRRIARGELERRAPREIA